MAIKGIPLAGSALHINRISARMQDLQVQLSTGKKAQSYGLMGKDRNIALRMRADIKSYQGYNEAIKRAQIQLGTVQNTLNSLGDITQNARADFNGTAMALHDGSYQQVMTGAEQRLSDGISLMNERIAGRYLFAGKNVNTQPVETVSNILNGVGARAGLRQVIDERKQADLGALDNGRLVVAAVGAQVNVTEDGVHNFGLKLGVVSQNITGVNVTGPAGAPQSMGIDFTGATPVEGQEITLRFILPDGENIDVKIVAKTSGTSDKDGFVIGANDADNTANFLTSVNAAIDFLANGEMKAASAVKAADGFFDEPKTRIDGPPFATAVALKAATDADTLSWYKGDKTTGGERDSYKIFASKNSVISAGVRADEEPMRDFVKNLSLMVAETFDPNSATSNAQYGALKSRVTAGLFDNNSKISVLELSTELGYKEKHLENLKIRNSSRVFLSQNVLSDVEEANIYEVSAKLLAYKTQLEVAYKTTSMISRISLVNFL